MGVTKTLMEIENNDKVNGDAKWKMSTRLQLKLPAFYVADSYYRGIVIDQQGGNLGNLADWNQRFFWYLRPKPYRTVREYHRRNGWYLVRSVRNNAAVENTGFHGARLRKVRTADDGKNVIDQTARQVKPQGGDHIPDSWTWQGAKQRQTTTRVKMVTSFDLVLGPSLEDNGSTRFRPMIANHQWQ